MLSSVARTATRAQAPLTASTQARSLHDKILIANRGEIACRVMKTAKKLGVQTVAVYSDVDANAKHTTMADEAYRIGTAASADSYLRQQKIIEVAKKSGAQAIHPGYGFLSENEGFSALCSENGIEFIGPPASAIRDMGSKSESKRIMIAAGVPVTPGYHGADQSDECMIREGAKVGYPLMIKAIMGGGGKGMRIVETPEDLLPMLESSRREALKSFGDTDVLLERYLRTPRHIEYQVFADKAGNCVYLFERDCSVQRRHQKILEEAPAPFLSEAARAEMGEAAVAAAKAVGYVGAGTVEFMLDDDGSFYFMEMNTRLQVEHPVTELITKQDLVEWQLRVADGEDLPMQQKDLKIHGHAIEARIYAENPYRDFLPQSGAVSYMRLPEGCTEFDPTCTGVRVDSGLRQGDAVSIFYDPMIAKLLVHDQDRAAALLKLRQAIRGYHIGGLQTNFDFLGRCLRHPTFVAGGVNTSFLNVHGDELTVPVKPAGGSTIAMAALAHALEGRAGSAGQADPWAGGPSACADFRTFRAGGARTDLTLLLEGEADQAVEVTLSAGADGEFAVSINYGASEEEGAVACVEKYTASGVLSAEDGSLQCVVARDGDVENAERRSCTVHAAADGSISLFSADDERYLYFFDVKRTGDVGEAAGESVSSLLAPMPGTVVKVMATAGSTMKKGETIMILEAMKMEHLIQAPFDGVLDAVNFEEGDSVPQDGRLANFTQQ
jgi:3-methylcrotonyl-CoA carboxylase alpha subunit